LCLGEISPEISLLLEKKNKKKIAKGVKILNSKYGGMVTKGF